MMAKIAKRRTLSRKSPKSFWPARVSGPRCSTSGTTISFETMIESATHSTITMAVAADRPPINTPTLSSGALPSIGSASTYMSLSTAPNGKVIRPGERDRNHEQVDGDQIQRKQPARPADLGVAGILDHADVKLARQQHDRAERQQHHGEEIAERGRVIDGAHGFRSLHRALDQFDRAEHPECDESAGGDKGHQLDDGFGCDRQHQAVLMFRRVGLAGSEQHREGRHRQRHDQRDIADDRNEEKAWSSLRIVSSDDATALSWSAM